MVARKTPKFFRTALTICYIGEMDIRRAPLKKKRGAPKPPIPPARGRFLGEFPGVRQGKRLDAGA